MEHYLNIMDGTAIAGLIFTKLVRGRTPGHLCNSILRLSRPIAALTRGGRQRGDIVIPDLETFGRILIEGKAW
jgi:flagellar biosynthesis GTPase FlhF